MYIIADFQGKMKKLIEMYINKFPNLSNEEIIKKIELANSADPTGNRAEYTMWIAKLDIMGNIKLPEDVEKIKNLLEKFDKYKKKSEFKYSKDIFSYKSYSDLAKVLEEIPVEKLETVSDKIKKGLKVLYSGPVYKVIEISTPEAAHHLCYSKQALHWCIKDVRIAENYLKDDVLYYFEKNGKPYALLHKSSKQFKDFYDEVLSLEQQIELYPLVKKFTPVRIARLELELGLKEKVKKQEKLIK